MVKWYILILIIHFIREKGFTGNIILIFMDTQRIQILNYFTKEKIKMQEKARKIVMDYFNTHVDVTDNNQITMDDVYVVWFCKTLQNWKALVSTNVSDGMYYEITHNGDKKETYVDKKWENFKVDD